MPAVNAANFHQPPVQRVSKPDVHGYFPAGGVPVPAVASNFIAADPPEEGRLVRIGNMLQVNPSFSIHRMFTEYSCDTKAQKHGR